MFFFSSVRAASPGHVEQRATRVFFFIAGTVMSAWAPLVPYAKARLTLDEASLGLLLLCLGTGSLIAMPFTGIMTGRFGCKRVTMAATALLALILPFLATAPSTMTLACALLLFGASLGTLDVAMNVHAVLVEKISGRAMMSGFHGLFSVGGFAGAAMVSLLLGLGFPPLSSVGCVAGLVVALLLCFGKDMLSGAPNEPGPCFALPRGWVLFIGGLCFVLFLTEGALLDWSALFLSTLRGLSPSQAGVGYAVFSVTMTVGRLTGDRIVRSLGSRNVLFYGSLCAMAGFAIAVFIPLAVAALAGFAMVGLGVSNIVPVLFSSTARQTVMPLNLAIAAVTTLGYTGLLIGPALIGFVAHATSLSTAFACLGVLLLSVTASAHAIARQHSC